MKYCLIKITNLILQLKEKYLGKRYVDRCNYKTNNTREDLINIIKDKSKVDYLGN